MSLISAHRDADMKLEKIVEAERRLLESERYARKLRGELTAAQQDRDQLIKALVKSEDIRKELHSRIADRQAASLRADLLGVKAAPITQMWIQEMKDLDAQLVTLPGESLLAACLVVYGGAMSSGQRLEAVGLWRECIQEAGLHIPSAPFNLDLFLWRRQDQLLGGMARHDVAALRSSCWMESLYLSTLAIRTPLIIDSCQEALNLIQDMQRGKGKICHYDLRETHIIDKVSQSIADGSTVVVQIHNPGSADEVTLMSAVAFTCSRTLQSSQTLELSPHKTHDNAKLNLTTGHRLYFRALSLGVDEAGGNDHSPSRLDPEVLRIASPVLFSYERNEMDAPPLSLSPLFPKASEGLVAKSSQLSRKLSEILIQSLLGIDASAEIREAKTNAWEAMKNAEDIR